MPIAIELVRVSKKLGGQPVVKNLDLRVPLQHSLCLLGESGCGKTTTLRLINGLLLADEGQVLVEGQPVSAANATMLRRSMGYSQQGSGLFPHLTVLDNISLIARKKGWSGEEIRQRSREVLDMVQLDFKEVSTKRPRQLSGGQRQRVGIARALFLKPKIMLMDEPFGALDPLTRKDVQDLFLQLRKQQSLTTVMVTHDLLEAFKMADSIALMQGGAVEQIGSKEDFMNSPASEYVERFVSSHLEALRELA